LINWKRKSNFKGLSGNTSLWFFFVYLLSRMWLGSYKRRRMPWCGNWLSEIHSWRHTENSKNPIWNKSLNNSL